MCVQVNDNNPVDPVPLHCKLDGQRNVSAYARNAAALVAAPVVEAAAATEGSVRQGLALNISSLAFNIDPTQTAQKRQQWVLEA